MKIAIIGAGLSGMSAAYDLSKAGHEVIIFEAADYVGGLASGFKKPNWSWSVEKYYHHWFETDAHLLSLAEELGLRPDIHFPRPVTVMYHNEKWYPFDSIPAALKFPGLGWGIDKIRFGLVGLYLRTTNNWKNLEKHTVHHWMNKWAGSRVYEKMWQPLLEGKFGPYAQDVNMAWMWARLKARTTRLGTYSGGFQKFADDFAEILQEKLGVKIYLSTPIEKIEIEHDGLSIQIPNNQIHFDKVLVTASPTIFSRMVPQLPASYLSGLQTLKSMGAVVIILSLSEKLSPEGYYWYNIPKSAGFPFLALVEHTNFVSPNNFDGEHIVYCGDYLPVDHRYFEMDKEDILEEFIPALQKINPSFKHSWINDSWLFRTKYAQPVPLKDHSKNIPEIETPIKNLFFASMSQVYPWDRGTNFAVEIGRKAAAMMLHNE